MASIFISHSSRDTPAAGEVKSWLEDHGYNRVFLDFDKDTGLGAGGDWERQLYDEVARCHAVIIVITPAWLESKWCFAEFAQARALGKVIFPLLMNSHDRKRIEPTIRTIQAELWNEAGRRHLLRRLNEVANEIARGHHWDPARSPWPGIASFEAEDAAVFFGRDPEIRKVCELLEGKRAHGGARLLLIVGGSGSGKSSVVKAGVLPYLARDPRRFITLPPFRPGQTPLTEYAKILAEAMGRPTDFEALRTELCGSRAQTVLNHILEALTVGLAREATPLLTVDQFEEVFTIAGTAERSAFLRVLKDFIGSGRPRSALVVATVRSDLLDEMLKGDDFAIAHDVFTLAPLPFDRLAKVIEGPARVAALTLEEGLGARILEDVGSTVEALPLLAFTLRELYERFGDDGKLTIVEYEALGDSDRRLRPLENVVRRKAEETLQVAAPSAAELSALKETFVGQLVRVNEEGVRLRYPGKVENIPKPARRLVQLLIEARLLSSRLEGQALAVEVAHEALFKAWPMLATWLDEEHDFLIGRRQIEEAKRLWETTSEKQKEKAVLSGLLLEKARTWNAAWPERLRDVRAYVVASIQKDDATRKRWERLKTVGVIFSAAISVLLAGLSSFAWLERNRAEQEAVVAMREARRADQEAVRAVAEAKRADGQRDDALRRQSLFLANLSQQQSARKDFGTALALALNALPDENDSRPYVPQAEAALYEAIGSLHERRVLRGIDNTLDSAAFSPDGAQVVTASSEGSVLIWDARSGAELAVLRGKDDLKSATFSPDGTRIVAASRHGTAILWNAISHKEIAVLPGDGFPTEIATFSPDSKRVLTASHGAWLWDATKGKIIAELRGQDSDVEAAVFSPSGEQIVTGSWDGIARVFNATDGTLLTVLKGHKGPVLSAQFSPDGARIVTASTDATARIWDAKDGAQLGVLRGHAGTLSSASFSPDGTRIVTASNDPSFYPDGTRIVTPPPDRTARVWDAQSGAEILKLNGHDAEIQSATFSSDGTVVLTASWDGSARVWSSVDGHEVAVLRGHDSALRSATFSPDERTIVTASDDGSVRLWDLLPIGANPIKLRGHEDRVFDASFSPDGAQVVTASGDRTARLWNATTGSELATFRGHEGTVWRAAFSSDGKMIVTASEDGTARIWSLTTLAQEIVLRGHTGGVTGAAFSPDNKRVVTTGGDSKARLWDANNGTALAVLSGHESSVQSGEFSPDGKFIVTASSDATARIWDANRGTQVTVLTGHGDAVTSASFSPDGAQVVTASLDGTALIWDALRGSKLATLRGHEGGVDSAAFSPDGKRVVTASFDNTVRLWDARSGEMLGLLSSLDGGYSVSFAPDAKRVLTASFDNTAIIRRVFSTTQDLVNYARSISPRPLTPVQRDRFFLE
ncbi:nSTAND1 domain-containing NTPase [Rhizobium ruizarguesonis]|uniref:nSTAND1 domain-containing NTPase n=1 Tax=Rhizobium ruizarguesonis TaxID=2081791 RepID=UPI0010307D8D|nr:TIR domain-containing protein [Rhizobium ruizarguesonis]MBY5896048.1 TIR domain-containing protein [Rhizobium leguminosarum]TBD26773.1 TIR domain-containing protein [Rhizobium ruizarguesonis]